MKGGEFATARRGIDPDALRMAHEIVQRSGYQAATLATGIATIDLRAHLLPPKPRPTYVPPPPPKREPLRFAPPVVLRERACDIIEEVAARYGLTAHDLISKRRSRKYAYPRQEAYWEVRRRCPHLSYPEIGRRFGGRDHTTILHGVRAHEKRMGAA